MYPPWLGEEDLSLARRQRGDKYGGSRCVEPGLVLDYTRAGKLLGIEFLYPELVTATALDAVLKQQGFPALGNSVCRRLAKPRRPGAHRR